MNSIPVTCPTTAALAKALRDHAAPGEAVGFTARPYNSYQNDDGLWWLVPTSEWPAYSRGKFTVMPLNELGLEPTPVLVGLTMEKGVKPGVAVNNKLFMEESWAWNRFFRALLSGEADQIASGVIARTTKPLTVAVRTHYITPKTDFLDQRYKLPSSFWIADYDSWTMHKRYAKFRLRDTEAIQHSARLSELATFLSSLEKLDWLWVDVYLGLVVELGCPESQAWPISRLWQEALQPWRKWFV